jgi:hypothetical protein
MGVTLESWEDRVKIDSIYEDIATKKLYGRVIWDTSEVTNHPLRWLYRKCPQRVVISAQKQEKSVDKNKMLRFYEGLL